MFFLCGVNYIPYIYLSSSRIIWTNNQRAQHKNLIIWFKQSWYNFFFLFSWPFSESLGCAKMPCVSENVYWNWIKAAQKHNKTACECLWMWTLVPNSLLYYYKMINHFFHKQEKSSQPLVNLLRLSGSYYLSYLSANIGLKMTFQQYHVKQHLQVNDLKLYIRSYFLVGFTLSKGPSLEKRLLTAPHSTANQKSHSLLGCCCQSLIIFRAYWKLT